MKVYKNKQSISKKVAKIIYRLSRLPKHTSGQNGKVKQVEQIKIIHSDYVQYKRNQENIFRNEISVLIAKQYIQLLGSLQQIIKVLTVLQNV